MVERRGSGRPEASPDWTSNPIAELHYTHRVWTVYSADRHGHWHRVEDLPAADSPDLSWSPSTPTTATCSGDRPTAHANKPPTPHCRRAVDAMTATGRQHSPEYDTLY
jgi:hypothetical protein